MKVSTLEQSSNQNYRNKKMDIEQEDGFQPTHSITCKRSHRILTHLYYTKILRYICMCFGMYRTGSYFAI